jgi:Pilus formation protein N terminal region
MSAVFGARRRLLGVVASALLAAAVPGIVPARADNVIVSVDQAHLLKLPDRVATIVIGNPLIADATLQKGGILVVTGKGYGSTNLLALDRDGHVIMTKTVQVRGPGSDNVIVVYRGADRESYSCAPECQPRITLGDATPYFKDALEQTSARNGQAAGGGNGGAAH